MTRLVFCHAEGAAGWSAGSAPEASARGIESITLARRYFGLVPRPLHDKAHAITDTLNVIFIFSSFYRSGISQ
jgi:hypothetical protein